MKTKPIAIACSDLHLSLLKPACRADKNWMETQLFYLGQLRSLASKYRVPVICAGDIFDRWNAPNELVRFALVNLPEKMICVPGQHDLPNHSMEEKHRSAYGVLVEAEKIIDLSSKSWGLELDHFVVRGFGWGEEIVPCNDEDRSNRVYIAAVHRYVWKIGASYPGAPEANHLVEVMKPLRNYDVAIFGDNHKGFTAKLKTGTNVMNCGTFIRRKSDEINYRPRVGIIYSDGSIAPHLLDNSIDQFHENPQEREEQPVNMREFLDQLEQLGEHGLDFREAVLNHLRSSSMDEQTKQIILKAIE